MATTCPYCNIEVRESDIEAEDGCCPECGAQISGVRSLLDDPDGEYGENDYDDGEDDVFSVLNDEDEDDDGNDFSRRDALDDDELLDGIGEDFDEELGENFDEDMFGDEAEGEENFDEDFDDK